MYANCDLTVLNFICIIQNGETALHLAVCTGGIELVELIDASIDLNVQEQVSG